MVKCKFKDRRKFNEMLILKGFRSLRAFSKYSGVGYHSLQQITSGLRTPSPRVAFMVCDALGMEFEELFVFHHGYGREEDDGKAETQTDVERKAQKTRS